MMLLRLVFRSLAYRRTTSLLVALSVALGVALVTSIVVLSQALGVAYENQGSGIPILVGPRGSRLELVLSVVYQRDRSPGLMPFRAFEELQKEPWVKLAVPYALGDSYRGFRIVGSSEGIFDPSFQPLPGKPLELSRGRAFTSDPARVREVLSSVGEYEVETREAVLGSEAARMLALDLGAELSPTHGVEASGQAHHEAWQVTGVLKKTGTALDRVIFVNLESFLAIDEHREGAKVVKEDGQSEPGISAVLLFPKSATAKTMMLPVLNKRTDLQAVSPAQEIARFLSMVGNVRDLLLVVAWAVVLVGALSVGSSLYGAMAARRHELAVLRAVGAHRTTVLWLLVIEAAALAFVGALAGVLLGHAFLYVFGPRLEQAAGCALELSWLLPLGREGVARAVPVEPSLVLAVTAVGAVAGLFPALSAYRTAVAENLGRAG